MANDTIGSTWFDEVNDPHTHSHTKLSTERWTDAVATHKSTVDTEQSIYEPQGGHSSPPSGSIPTPSETLKVTSWYGQDLAWHWVSTERNPGEGDEAWQARHESYVNAAQDPETGFPPLR